MDTAAADRLRQCPAVCCVSTAVVPHRAVPALVLCGTVLPFMPDGPEDYAPTAMRAAAAEPLRVADRLDSLAATASVDRALRDVASLCRNLTHLDVPVPAAPMASSTADRRFSAGNGADTAGLGTWDLLRAKCPALASIRVQAGAAAPPLPTLGAFRRLEALEVCGGNLPALPTGHGAALSLRTLRVARTQCDVEWLRAAVHVPVLEELDISGTPMSPADVVAVAVAAPRLVTLTACSLSLDGCAASTTASSRMRLSVASVDVSKSPHVARALLPRTCLLRCLQMDECAVPASILAAAVARSRRTLTRISAAGTSPTEEVAASVADCPRLEVLSFARCRGVGDAMAEGLAFGAASASLRAINLTDTECGDGGAVALATLRGLQVCELSGSRVSSPGLVALASGPAAVGGVLRVVTALRCHGTLDGARALLQRSVHVLVD